MMNPILRAAAIGVSAAYRISPYVRPNLGSGAEMEVKSRARQLFGGRPLSPRFDGLHALIRDGEHLLNRQFGAPELGQPTGNVPRDIIVVDNFYEDPDAVRRYALSLRYERYVAGWYSSALETRENPLRGQGTRLATPAIRERLAQLTHAEVDELTWPTAGDGWNGVFHYKLRRRWSFLAPVVGSTIHNHVGRDSDVRHGGWSAIVYLSPRTPRSAGTTIWLHRATQRCWALDSVYSMNWDEFEPILEIENRYNRLVIIYASIFHLSPSGWGARAEGSRLFQTFFWNTTGAARERGT